MAVSEIRSIDSISKNLDNPRVIKDDKFKKLVSSIKSAQWMLDIRPIVVDENSVILGGNMRYEACKEAGIKSVPVLVAKDLSEEQKKEFIIKDNVGFGDWEWEILANDWDINLLQEWGLDIPDIHIESNDEVIEDDVTTNIVDEIETNIVEGDLIEIGIHRLVCGDSTRPDHVMKLMDGNEPYLMVTDPPYGVEYDPNWRNERGALDAKIGGRSIGKVENDDKADWAEAWSISPAKVAYVYHAGKYSGIVQKSLEDCDFEIRSQIIWAKSHFAIGRGDYHWKHEPCWYAVKKGSKSAWKGARDQHTVWEIAKNQSNESGHSTQKPVECMHKAIRNHDGDVYDPFLGSGTTMVAAHQLDRKCYGIELNPKYCQIIINRMKTLDPELIVKFNGEIQCENSGHEES